MSQDKRNGDTKSKRFANWQLAMKNIFNAGG